MKNESAFSASICKALLAEGVFCQAIESGGTSVGIPDLYIRTRQTGTWMELKNLIYPIREYLEVPFRPGQFAWLTRHAKMGGRSALAIAHPDGILFFHGAEIQQTYIRPFPASLSLSRVNGRAIVEWLDSRKEGI